MVVSKLAQTISGGLVGTLRSSSGMVFKKSLSRSLKDIWRTREENTTIIPRLKYSHYILTSQYVSFQASFSVWSFVAVGVK